MSQVDSNLSNVEELSTYAHAWEDLSNNLNELLLSHEGELYSLQDLKEWAKNIPVIPKDVQPTKVFLGIKKNLNEEGRVSLSKTHAVFETASKDIGFPLLLMFEPQAVDWFIKKQNPWLGKALKSKRSVLSNQWMEVGLNDWEDRLDKKHNGFFESFLWRLKEILPEFEVREAGSVFSSTLDMVFNKNKYSSLKTLHKVFPSFLVPDAKFTKVNSSILKQGYSQIKSSEMLKAALDCGFSLEDWNRCVLKKNPAWDIGRSAKNFCFLYKRVDWGLTKALLDEVSNHASFKNEDLEVWHKNTISFINIQSHFNSKQKETIEHYLMYVMERFPSHRNWYVYEDEKNDAKIISFLDLMSFFGFEKQAAYSKLMQDSQSRISTPKPIVPRF